MSIPAPPPGFTLESDDAPAQQAMPPPPAGFKLDEEASAPAAASDNSWWGAIKGVGDAGLAVGSSGLKAVTHAVNDILPGAEGRAKLEKEIQTDPVLNYHPQTEGGKVAMDALGHVFAPVSWATQKAHEAIASATNERTADVVGDLTTMALTKGGAEARGAVAGAAGKVADAYRDLVAKGREASVLDSPQSMGAARAAPDLEEASAPLQQAVRAASRKGPVNETARDNHLEADQHGIQLMEGQATRDPAQFSNEQNSTHGAIVRRIGDQEAQMVDALDNIRREAAPGHVQNDPIENGQVAVDALKAYDEPVKAAIDAKYAAARKASATGDLQMDGRTFVKDAMEALKPQNKYRFLPETARGIINDVNDAFGTMSLDDFQAYSTQLGNEIAKAKRVGDGNAAFAIGKVNEALQKVQPIGTESAEAKALFDQARAAAKARFDAFDADPAYQAAVDDVSLDGVKRGKPSALADKFLDKYVLQAPRANAERVMQKFDPDAQQAVASHVLSTIRKSAVGSTGKISPAGYNSAVAKYDPKLDILLSPETRESIESLGRVIHNAKVAPPGNFVNYSKSGVISNAAHGVAQPLAEAALNAKTFGMGVPVIKGIAESNFAKRSLAPGAGLTKPMPGPLPIARASGGKVDHEALLGRLVQRYKAAKKMNDAGTETLLKAPDASIIRALDIAQENSHRIDNPVSM
jgi:hypothetical protein